jgi:hypothetical protein
LTDGRTDNPILTTDRAPVEDHDNMMTLLLIRLFEVTKANVIFWRFWSFVLKSTYGTQGAALQQR